MGLKLHYKDLEEITFNSGNVNYLIDIAGTKEYDHSFEYRGVKGSFKEIVLENFRIGYGCSYLDKKTTLLFDFENETVEMHFSLNGDTKTSMDSMHRDFSFCSNEHNIFYCSNSRGSFQMCSKHSHIFEVNLNPDFFTKYLPKDEMFDSFKELIKNHQAGFMSNHNYPITPEMHFIIREIIKCQWKGHYRKLFLEAKVLELLMLQMKQIQEISERGTIVTDPVDIERMTVAKEVITNRLSDPLTLSDLAKQVGTNECALKKGFKKVFGTTVFGYIQDAKMNNAKKLLLEQKMSINQVADITGYKNPQHFSTAFKKKFGIPPSYLKEGKCTSKVF
ncbi:helix-turn-helix domain-containing protein [Aquimarina sp. TRL1]|uniref:helix-turn-helix transcriptional regulator n=1 Tax=Aquimarina sp. (strain TRL1) TaxID=2736252 RepID=UPI00158B87A6|nr:helix-turn-helix domain-containing protein [Aquimarina sp. TRL1]QKX04992.1 helix-turn-helix domain-containing protein [Aquimarina sp. TRL1]